ncbi:MAG TPA: hypothetical protein PLM07_09230 [Candidatus Rifleibacterium sp.]|nr:hypothetical protein [Candidatus Rifleibacterium sp.]HPT46069.1 hypothetical protein [Candidatus Rifleibacterium sp.]
MISNNTISLVLYWAAAFLVVMGFPMVLEPLLGPENPYKFIETWIPLYLYLKAPGAALTIAKICVASAVLDIFFISNFLDRYERLWYWCRVVILLAVAFPYLYVLLAHLNTWFATRFQESVPVSVD